MKKLMLALTVLFITNITAPAQVIRRTAPAVTRDTMPKINRNIGIRPPKDNNIRIPEVKPDVLNSLYDATTAQLYFFDKEVAPECQNNCVTLTYSFQKQFTYYINGAFSSRDWKYEVIWKNLPVGAVKGKWQISFSPFTEYTTEPVYGLIKEGVVDIPSGMDSILFNISFNEKADLYTPTKIDVKNTAIKTPKAVPLTPNTKALDKGIAPAGRPKKTSYINIAMNKELFVNISKELLERKFYIRIIPYNTRGAVINAFTNILSIIEKIVVVKKPTPPEPYLADDYTITNLKYTPVHYPNPSWSNCAIVVNPGNSVFGFKDGQVICPQPAKEKSWYEKAFNGVTGFVTSLYDGAAKFYNETKTYLKDKWREFNCDIVSSPKNSTV